MQAILSVVLVYGLFTVCQVECMDHEDTYREIHSKFLWGSEPNLFKKLVKTYYEYCPREPSWCDKLFLGSDDSFPIIDDDEFLEQVCPPCSCEMECIFRQNCCPGSMFGFAKRRTKTKMQYLTVEPRQLLKEESNDWFYFVQDCGVYGTDTPECHNVTDWAPVTSIVSGIAYYNQHCASCNGDHNVEVWQTGIISCHFLDTFSETDKIDIMLEEHPFFPCDLLYYYSQPYIITEEDWGDIVMNYFYSKQNRTIDQVDYSSCNMTGLWSEADLDIIAACALYDTPYIPFVNKTDLIHTVSFRNTYKNVFCFICNPSVAAHYFEAQGDVIDSCYSQDGAQKMCDGVSSPPLYPYKNIGCLYCNVVNNVSDIHDTNTTKHVYETFQIFSVVPYRYVVILNVSHDELKTVLESTLETDDMSNQAIYSIPSNRYCNIEYGRLVNECSVEAINYNFKCTSDKDLDAHLIEAKYDRGVYVLMKYILCTTQPINRPSDFVIDTCDISSLNVSFIEDIECPFYKQKGDRYISVLGVMCDNEIDGLLSQPEILPEVILEYCSVEINPTEGYDIEKCKTNCDDKESECFEFPWYFGRQFSCRNDLGGQMSYRQLFAANGNFEANREWEIDSDSNECPLDMVCIIIMYFVFLKT